MWVPIFVFQRDNATMLIKVTLSKNTWCHTALTFRQWSWQPGLVVSNSPEGKFQTIRSQLLRTEHRPWGRQLRQLEEISSLCSRGSMEKKQGLWEKKKMGESGGRLLRSSIGKVWSKHTGNVREQRNPEARPSQFRACFLQLWWTLRGQGRAECDGGVWESSGCWGRITSTTPGLASGHLTCMTVSDKVGLSPFWSGGEALHQAACKEC